MKDKIVLGLIALYYFSILPVFASDCDVALSIGKDVKVCAKLAATDAEKAKGLMFVKKLDYAKGMLFIFDEDSVKTFWMKNTLIPLDIIFMDENFTVVKVFHNVPPSYEGQEEEKIPRVSFWARYVLEIKGSTAEKMGIVFGKRFNAAFNKKKK